MLLALSNFLSSLLLLIVFAMIAQKRVQTLLNLFIWQGLALTAFILNAAYLDRQVDLLYSASLTLLLKVIVVPIILQRLINKLKVKSNIESLVNMPTIMIIGIGLVVLAFNVVLPMQQAGEVSSSTLGIALACVLLAILMLITRKQAVSQVIAFLTLENGLIFAAASHASGMPLIVELGTAFDILVGTLIFGVFFLHIRAAFDSLDIQRLEKIHEATP